MNESHPAPKRAPRKPKPARESLIPEAGITPDLLTTLPAAPPAGDFPPLLTERLKLRPYCAADAADLHRLINDWEVCRTLAAVPFPYSRELAEQWIDSTARSRADGSAVHLAITGAEGAREVLVGGAGLRISRAERSARLGYWVGRRFWGHGVASEAAKRLAEWAMANLEIDRLEANVAADNPASMAVLRRVGMRDVGEGVETFIARGGELRVRRFEANRRDLFGDPAPAPSADGATPLLLVAACALVDIDGRVLLARRPEGKKLAGLWEFPGGKLAPGETPEAGLIRELKEELGIDVSAACLAPFAFASHAYPGFHLLMPLYLCRRWRGTIEPREGQALKWVHKDKLAEYRMPEADRPLVPLLRDFL